MKGFWGRNLFLITALSLIFTFSSCHKGSNGGGDDDFRYKNDSYGCSEITTFTGSTLGFNAVATTTDSEKDKVRARYENCSKLKEYWDTAFSSFQSSGITVEQVNNISPLEGYDVYKISGTPDKKAAYENIMKTFTDNLEVFESGVEEHTILCLNKFARLDNCPDCVNDLIAVRIFDVHDAPSKDGISYNCVSTDEGCNMEVHSCGIGKSYIQNISNKWWHDFDEKNYFIRDVISDNCEKNLSTKDGYLVFKESVLSCLSLDTDNGKPDIQAVLQKLCTEESIPKLYSYTTERVREGGVRVTKYYDENHNEIQTPINIEDYRTSVWNVKKLKLEHPRGSWTVMDKTLDKVLTILIPQGGYKCSFE